MKKLVLVAFLTALLTACATTGDVENIQNQITEVSTQNKRNFSNCK